MRHSAPTPFSTLRREVRPRSILFQHAKVLAGSNLQLVQFTRSKMQARAYSHERSRVCMTTGPDMERESQDYGASMESSTLVMTRRSLATSSLLFGLASGVGPCVAAETIADRLTSASPLYQPSLPLFGVRQPVFYPKWMFGEWLVTEANAPGRVLQAPLGEPLVPVELLGLAVATGLVPSAADPPCEPFLQRYYSTLPDTLSNQLSFNLGILPRDAIIADTAFNLAAHINARLHSKVVSHVELKPQEGIGRAVADFARLAPDLRPLPPQRLEVFVNRIDLEEPEATSELSQPVFSTSVLGRYVLIGVGSVDVADWEIITKHTLLSQGHVQVQRRIAIYLDPRSPRFFEVRGRAVLLHDCIWDMERQKTEGAEACVVTPKDVVQCV